MLVKNISLRKYIHGDVILEPGCIKDVADDICKIWVATGDIISLDDGSKDSEIERLKAENERLKAQANNSELESLKAKAKELKIKGYSRMSVETLKQRIAEAE